MHEHETEENAFWMDEMTLDDLRSFVEKTRHVPGDVPVVIHVITRFADEATWQPSDNKLMVAQETPVRAAGILIESFSEDGSEYGPTDDGDGSKPSAYGEERTHLCEVYMNVVSARNMFREDVNECGDPK